MNASTATEKPRSAVARDDGAATDERRAVYRPRREEARLLPPAALERAIGREADLAERASLDYCVVVIDVDRRLGAVALDNLLSRIFTSLRPGDEVGWIDGAHLALSLPLCEAAAAAARAVAILGPFRSLTSTVYWLAPGGFDARRAAASGVATLPLDALLYNPSPRWKRGLDVAGAVVLLVLTAPVVLLAALLVRATSRGPVFHRQRRAGLHGVPFTIYKFRTMVVGAEAMKAALLRFNERSGPVFKMKNDPRVTRIGRLLRATSIDELPQLWNVLRGEMSLVGPRPPTLDEVPEYRTWHRRRLSVRPGITCFWQVAARGGVDFDDWVRMDLRYIAQRSFLCDLRVLAATVPAVLGRRGAS